MRFPASGCAAGGRAGLLRYRPALPAGGGPGAGTSPACGQ